MPRKDSLGNNLKKKTVLILCTTQPVLSLQQKRLFKPTSLRTQVRGNSQKTDCTYLKSPAGIFTQATLPINKIYEELSNDTINAVVDFQQL